MRTINFVKEVIIITTKSYAIGLDGGTVNVDLSTNTDYTVEIPEEDQSWVSIAQSRTAMRNEIVTFQVQPNENATYRYSIIKFIDKIGETIETVLITQNPKTSSLVVNVKTPGTLKDIMGEYEKNNTEILVITGILDGFYSDIDPDFEFIKTMPILKTLDLSGLQNETLPSNCLSDTKISTVILPAALKAIPPSAFCKSSITSINIPETVEGIGSYAFAETPLKGNIVIPDHVVTIGASAFENCSSLTGNLDLPESVTTIGMQAFFGCTGFKGYLKLGSNVESIGISAFLADVYSANTFNKIYCMATIPPSLGTGYAFDRWETPLFVPIGCKTKYEEDKYGGWSRFTTIEETDFKDLINDRK